MYTSISLQQLRAEQTLFLREAEYFEGSTAIN